MTNILVVEDDKDIQILIQRYLSELNVELHFADTGEEGVEKYEKLKKNGKTPDMVVMDLDLPPGINGVETTKRIMKIDENANVYGFTAYFDTKWATELKDAGAKGVMGRPIGFNGFRDRVKKILGMN